jgi:putative glutamine amidotransferase
MVRPLTSSNRAERPVQIPIVPPAREPEQAVRTLKTAAVRRRPSPLSLHTLEVRALGADLLLPAAGDDPEATFALYQDRVRGVFSPREERVLAAVTTSPSPPFDPDQPVVGVILSEPGAFHGDRHVREIVDEMHELGCRVVLIPPCADLLMPSDPAGRANGILSMVRRLDGLVGPGGDDIDPSLYGEKNQHTDATNVRRDRFEADLALAAKSEDLFMFGICRSHQLWNAADDGSLIQDVEKEGYASRSLRQKATPIPFDQPFVVRDDEGKIAYEYRVHLDPNSRMSEVTRQTELVTNANHHQAVDRPGSDLDIVGHLRDARTGREMVEATERWNTFTVQWHPEAMWSDPIQRRLLGTVARRAALFRAAKRLSEGKTRVTKETIEAWYQSRFGVMDRSDSRWLRRDLIPHWYGKLAATGSVDGR